MQPIFPLSQFVNQALSANWWTYLVFGVIGFAFGYVLEISGFGNSKKLAAQFYFKDLTVLKVMFTAIVTAMVLLFLASAVGILDFNLVYVPETHLWPGIVGGLIMGVGFIVGGFCPGTSLVSASTLKVDGIIFVLGAVVGVWAFGETVDPFWDWWNQSGYYGRLTLMDVTHLPTGWVVLLVVFMALFMFWGAEQLERIVGKRDMSREPKLRLIGAAALVVIAVAIILIGQPTASEKYAKLLITREVDGQNVQLSPDKALEGRMAQIHPGELLASLADQKLNIVMLDVRSEADYNLFHIKGAQNVPLDEIRALAPGLLSENSSNTIIVLMSNDEAAATEAWKVLQAESVPNVYILEGGVNNWISIFAADEAGITPTTTPVGDDQSRYSFEAALGDRYAASDPAPYEWELEYTPKIQLQRMRGVSGGGCG
ncbi:MAG: Rhodanese-related sulfurtransferase [Anaerolineaceae bacterium]|nr:MAG: Rhodanese-related sulfurtransferase [Anaerolineaceae bacterium]